MKRNNKSNKKIELEIKNHKSIQIKTYKLVKKLN